MQTGEQTATATTTEGRPAAAGTAGPEAPRTPGPGTPGTTGTTRTTATTGAPGTTASSARGGAAVALILGGLAFLPAANTDMYLPSLPDVARDLSTTAAAAQVTISCVMVGGALSQLVVGPLSDRFGRRPPAVVGLVGFAVVALLCVVAQSIGQLVALRVLQGVMGAAASVVAIAFIGDRYQGAEAARLMSRLWLAIAVAPLLAPLAGTWIAERWGWRAVFVVLAGIAALLAVGVARGLPETLPPERRTSRGLAAWIPGYRAVLGDRQFLALALVPALGLAAIMTYVVGSPFVYGTEHGLSAREFSLVFGVGATGMMLGSQVNASVVRRVGPARLLRATLPSTVLCFAVMVACTATGTGGIAGLVVPMWCATALLATVFSNASALAVSRHPGRAGTAAAVMGVVQSAVAAAVSPLVGVLGGTGVTMSVLMLASLLVAVAVLGLGTPAYRRGGALRLSVVR